MAKGNKGRKGRNPSIFSFEEGKKALKKDALSAQVTAENDPSGNASSDYPPLPGSSILKVEEGKLPNPLESNANDPATTRPEVSKDIILKGKNNEMDKDANNQELKDLNEEVQHTSLRAEAALSAINVTKRLEAQVSPSLLTSTKDMKQQSDKLRKEAEELRRKEADKKKNTMKDTAQITVDEEDLLVESDIVDNGIDSSKGLSEEPKVESEKPKRLAWKDNLDKKHQQTKDRLEADIARIEAEEAIQKELEDDAKSKLQASTSRLETLQEKIKQSEPEPSKKGNNFTEITAELDNKTMSVEEISTIMGRMNARMDEMVTENQLLHERINELESVIGSRPAALEGDCIWGNIDGLVSGLEAVYDLISPDPVSATAPARRTFTYEEARSAVPEESEGIDIPDIF